MCYVADEPERIAYWQAGGVRLQDDREVTLRQAVPIHFQGASLQYE